MFPKKGWILILLAFFLCVVFNFNSLAFIPQNNTGTTGPVPDLFAALEQEPYVPVIIMLKNNAAPYFPPPYTADRDHHAETFVQELQETARKSRQKLEPAITAEIKKGNMRAYKPFWIINAFRAEVNAAALQKFAALPQVLHITPDRQHTLPAVETTPGQSFEIPFQPSAQGQGVENHPWNLQQIGAPAAWREGITGRDVVVAIMDTGVDPHHPALQGSYRGNLPGQSHATSWYDAAAADDSQNSPPHTGPCDLNGHGTHIAGIILGGNPAEPLGVAPGACWIGVNIFTRGLAWDSHIIQAFQWLMAPGGKPQYAPRIINCSWASRPEYVTDYLQWEILHRLEQAGIFVVFAAGNNKTAGPGSPASYPHAFAVGAVQKEKDGIKIADFSSRGPVQWREMEYLKPELTAPGVNIRSAWLNDGYITLDGTSLAAAHVSGTAALLLESNPQLTPYEIGAILKQTASWNPSWNLEGKRPNNTYGFGTLNACAALQQAIPPPREIIFQDGAEAGILNWSTSPDTPWKISREKVCTGNLAFADSPWENYKNNTSSWLCLAWPLALGEHHSLVLSFQHFHDLQKGTSGEDDYGYLEISPDGQNWLSLYRFSGSNRQFSPFSIPLHLPQNTTSFYLRFRLQSNNNGPGKGWYIDDVAISALASPAPGDPPPETDIPGVNNGDLNNDRRLDLIDLALLSLAFHTQPGDKNWNPRADLNGDGNIDFHDLNILAQKLSTTPD
jgi:hypothetical protein